jgi:hypothetical protein
MILLSIGLPSRFAEWCDGIICALVRAAEGPFDLASGNTLEEIALAAIKSRSSRLVIGARQPTDELRAALSRAGSRFVVALDDPHEAFRNLVTRHGLDWKAAVRAAAGSCAAILSYVAMPGALVLRADQEGNDPIGTATAIARWLDLAVNPADIAELAEGQSGPSEPSAQDRTDSWWDTISASDRVIVDGALNGYVDYFRGAGVGQMIWARDLFFIGDDPNSAADGVIDLSGSVRNLLFGPYLTLPPGQWAATVVLAVSKDAADLSYSVEILAGAGCACLGRGTIQPRGEGICEETIEFTVDESTDQPVALRVANLRYAFSGRLALVHVAVSPRLKPRPHIPAELTRALGL